MSKFKKGVDDWIKDLNARLSEVEKIPAKEMISNIDHNYDLIYALKGELERLRQDIELMKAVQILNMEKKIKGKRLH